MTQFPNPISFALQSPNSLPHSKTPHNNPHLYRNPQILFIKLSNPNQLSPLLTNKSHSITSNSVGNDKLLCHSFRLAIRTRCSCSANTAMAYDFGNMPLSVSVDMDHGCEAGVVLNIPRQITISYSFAVCNNSIPSSERNKRRRVYQISLNTLS
jgi:hypothetical protein